MHANYVTKHVTETRIGERLLCALPIHVTCIIYGVCVCPPPRLLITSGIIWRDIDPYDWLNKFYRRYMGVVVVIVNGCGLALIRVIAINPPRVS